MLIDIRRVGEMTFKPYDLGGHFLKSLHLKLWERLRTFLKISPNWLTGVFFVLIVIRSVGKMTFASYDLGGHFKMLTFKNAGKLRAFLKIFPNRLTGTVFYADRY